MKDEPFQILLVEDNDADVYLLRKAFEAAALNFELTVIDDGRDAINYVQRGGEWEALPDLAILDMNLPKNDGPEVLRALRNVKEFSKLPVIVFSSLWSPSDKLKIESFDVARCLNKPLNLEEFLQMGTMVSDLLRRMKE